LAYDPEAKYEAIVRFAQSLPGEATPPAKPGLVLAGNAPSVGFVDAPAGQVFVRVHGQPSKPAIILLHDAPGTGLMLDGLARGLADDAYVIVPDLPAGGESAAPSPEQAIIDAAADAVGAIADAFALTAFTLAAKGAGCAPAAAFAARRDPRLSALVLEDAEGLSAEDAAFIAPDIDLSPEGAHWIKAWLMLRDGEIYKPWFDGGVGAQRRTQGNFDADWLHDQTVALMKSRATYQRLPRAACTFDTAGALSAAAAPVQRPPLGGLHDALAARLRSDGVVP
jgi:pimeloyl-ACP methyl ester carboxylesterase